MRVLVVNAGSSSLKLAVVGGNDHVLAARALPATEGAFDEDAVTAAVGELMPVDAVGHRIVHGGTEFTAPVRLTPEVIARLRRLVDLAPLHQPISLRMIEIVGRASGDVPAVGCFDTAFHSQMPAESTTYALPAHWRERWELRRYGFHGLSHAWAARRTAELVGRPSESLRIVSCHLGSGASLCAIEQGRSVDTTMGFTPLEGLVMATRSGSVDPGLVLWLQEHAGLPPSELADTLEHRSGMLGLSGSSDMRTVLTSAAAGDAAALDALAVYVHRLCAGVAAMAAAMNGLDVLVFTGGIGEHAAEVRDRCCERLGFLGVRVDQAKNDASTTDADIGAADSTVRVLVVAAREDLEIARSVRAVIDSKHLPG